MPTHLLALGSSLALALAGGLRTDRLSPKQLRTWNEIVEIVRAEDGQGQPLYPTLRRLFDAVDESDHLVYVEMPKSKRSYVAGRFAVTRVDPAGKSHEGRLTMNLHAIDNVSTGPAAARPNGFVPFKERGKRERYAEPLGHELAHAVWFLADVDRARIAERLQAEAEERIRRVVRAGDDGPGEELADEVMELDRLAREIEETAEAAEVAIWKELRASRLERIH